MKSNERKKYHKLKFEDTLEKKKIVKRLAIIEGQMRGIASMVEEDRYCTDILIQITSSEKALRSLSNYLLEHHLRTCITEEIQKGNLDAIDEIVTIIKRYK